MLITRLVKEEGAHIYVCGGIAMANGVRKLLADILSNKDLDDDNQKADEVSKLLVSD